MEEAGGTNSTDNNSHSDPTSPDENPMSPNSVLSKMSLPKIVGIGLTGVLEIIRESKDRHPTICLRALESLLNILQGLQPEELSKDPLSITEPLFNVLLELASSSSNSKNSPGRDVESIACSAHYIQIPCTRALLP